MPATQSDILRLLEELGIDAAYGRDPYRPMYAESQALVDVEPNIVGGMQRLAPGTAEAWLGMKATAGKDGIELLLVSGFRSIAHQAEVLRSKLARGATLEAVLAVSAAPGFSQHHSGRAVDIATRGARPLTEEFEASPAFAWLAANAPRFGFRMPYGRQNRFGFAYEPWHWAQLED